MIDAVIMNGRVIDGTGNPWFKADIGIKDGKIDQIGKLNGARADQVIDAQKLVVCPGFIDIHAHSDLTLLVNPKAESKIRQGVTTEVVGNCGFSAAPVRREAFEDLKTFMRPMTGGASIDWDWFTFSDYLRKLERAGISVNVAPLVGNGTLRVNVMGFEARSPTEDELSQMKSLLAESMEQGALGMSSGLGYTPACHATINELVDLCKVVAERDGLYTTHIRDEADEVVEAAQEAVETGARSGVRVEINHYKPEGRRNWKKLRECMDVIESARGRGVDVTYDVYPYLAGAAPITHTLFVPAWAQEAGTEEMIKRLQNPEIRERIREEARDGSWKGSILSVATWDECIISFCKKSKNLQGKTISEIAKDRKMADPFDAIFDLAVEEEGAVEIIVFHSNEEGTSTMMRNPLALIASDGMAFAPYGVLGEARPHPRYYGTFPRLLGKYVREDRVLTLQDAVRKITSSPAQKLGLRDRGLIRQGSCADIVILDPQTIIDKATFIDPHQYPEGIRYVLVNGRIVVDNGKHMGLPAGQALRRK